MTHQELLAALKKLGSRTHIRTADEYVADVVQCGEAVCHRYFPDLGDTDALLMKAASTTTYSDPDTLVSAKSAKDAGGFGGLVPEGIEVPDKTLMVLHPVITTTRKDRDGDVLETSGAMVAKRLPLLWQHIATVPVGVALQMLDHTDTMLKSATALLDVGDGLAVDAATLIDADALGISHGFKSVEWKFLPGPDGKQPTAEEHFGFHVLKFEIMEHSLVSVPSNVDAIITQSSRGNLHTDMVKRWAKGYFDKRQKMVKVGADLESPGSGGGSGASVKVSTVLKEPSGQEFQKHVEVADKQDLADALRVADGGDCSCHEKGANSGHRTASDSDKPVQSEDVKDDSKEDAWDAVAAVGRLRAWAGVDADQPTQEAWGKYAEGFGRVTGDGVKLGDFSFPCQDVIDGKLVPSKAACLAGIAACNGEKCHASFASEEERLEVYCELSEHLDKDETPELETIEPGQAKDASLKAVPHDDLIVIWGDEELAELHIKQGRTLSKANEGRLQDAMNELAEVSKLQDVPRAALALVRSASSLVGTVLKQVTSDEEQRETKVSGLKDVTDYLLWKADDKALAKVAEVTKCLADLKVANEKAEAYRRISGKGK